MIRRVVAVSNRFSVPVDEFHNPPPSAAATLPSTKPPLNVTVPLPVMCKPPPLPGLAVAGATPALLLVSVILVSVLVESAGHFDAATGAVCAIAVDRRTRDRQACPVLNTPPPLPEVPLAMLFVIIEPSLNDQRVLVVHAAATVSGSVASRRIAGDRGAIDRRSRCLIVSCTRRRHARLYCRRSSSH